MSQRLTGLDIDVMIGDYLVHFEEISITIDDSSTTSKSKGRANGYVRGMVSASGDITVDTANFNVIVQAAQSAGSFSQLEPFDVVFAGETTADSLKIEAFDCLLKISDLLSASVTSEDKLTHKLTYDVTGKEFVRINGVPYLNDDNIESLK